MAMPTPWMLVITFAIGFVSAVWLMRKLTCTQRRSTVTRTVGTQSQVTYTALANHVNPIFSPLPEAQQGVFKHGLKITGHMMTDGMHTILIQGCCEGCQTSVLPCGTSDFKACLHSLCREQLCRRFGQRVHQLTLKVASKFCKQIARGGVSVCMTSRSPGYL